MADDSLSPVYNLRGCVFENLGDSNIQDVYPSLYENGEKIYIDKDVFIFNGRYLDNTRGVFKNASLIGLSTDTRYSFSCRFPERIILLTRSP